MKDKIKKMRIYFLLSLPFIIFGILIGIQCYDRYLVNTKELVIDSCIVRGVSYDDEKTLLVVELPDHTFSIVDASIYRSRLHSERPIVNIGDLIRCRWKHGDTGRLGYSSRQKGD